jgi:hypothetical protein
LLGRHPARQLLFVHVVVRIIHVIRFIIEFVVVWFLILFVVLVIRLIVRLVRLSGCFGLWRLLRVFLLFTILLVVCIRRLQRRTAGDGAGGHRELQRSGFAACL